ncbi:MAG: glycosyltransferase [Betaproteobacteria bacterium]|nr:glycosyltransferase [Betaproteobacteria bacterium]
MWNLLGLQTYILALVAAILLLPDRIWDEDSQQLLAGLGLIAAWRYGWWGVHLLRALVFEHRVFPRLRAAAEHLWSTGWRPQRLHFMMTTFRERREITERVLDAILAEVQAMGVPTTLYVGIGDDHDEEAITAHLAHRRALKALELHLVRQPAPGKRMAIGAVLRAMAADGIGGDDPVVFLDGDVVLEPDSVRRCLPFFALNPRLQALTTDERAEVIGPAWMHDWLALRFAQRDLGMKSHALSGKVLTLTGRMSVFRACNVVQPGFYGVVEADALDHWLWGRFRFLSGDDKSTWYWLLCQGAEMLYVPDARVVTVEVVEGNGIGRMQANLLRWSGNMLRNGSRAIALGPRKVGGFIWWCLVDQRIAIWTPLIGPVAALGMALAVTWAAIPAFIIWVAATRLVLAAFLFRHAGGINMRYPFLLYANQMLNAAVKAYIWFRLPKQRWANRGNQKARQHEDGLWQVRNWIARYLTAASLVALAWGVMLYLGLLPAPGWTHLRLLLA